MLNLLPIKLNPYADALQSLLNLVQDNVDKLDTAFYYELIEAIEEADHENESLNESYFDAEDKIEALKDGFTEFKDQLNKVITFEEGESFENKVTELVNELDISSIRPQSYEWKTDNSPTQKSDIEKMKALGYTFKEDRIIETVEPVKTEIIEEAKEIEVIEEPVKEKLVATVTQLDENTYSIKNREIDAEYNSLTQKLSGKGARKYKAQMLELVTEFIENNEAQEVSTNDIDQHFESLPKWQEDQVIVNRVIRGKFAIELLKGLDYQGKPAWTVHCVDIETNELVVEMSDTIYLSLEAAQRFINSIEDVKTTHETYKELKSYYSKTAGKQTLKHYSGNLDLIIDYVKEEAYMYGYCDILENDKIIYTAHKARDDYAVKLIKH